MRVLDQVSLLDCNTLHLPARARHFAAVRSLADLREGLAFCRMRELPLLMLGGGSNVVLREQFDGCVLKMEMHGEELLQSNNEHVEVRVAAGTVWHGLVLACHRRGWYGLENLALIPGTVGAAPIQNIGAYGVELSDLVRAVSVVDRHSGESGVLDNAACAFAYRHSLFKDQPRFVITDVTLRLQRVDRPRCDYPALREELAGIEQPRAADVLSAVIAIRRRRLPDPALLPNAGSFFKNPIIDAARFARLLERYPEVAHWPYHGAIKLAAAWLVDQAGWKGFREGDAAVHQQQALVLVNHGSATATALLQLAGRIQRSVKERFDVELELEPQVC